MALSGIEIYKLLPRTNCRACGFPTCLAFAMKVAARQAKPQDCPHIAPEALDALVEAATAPVVEVTVGTEPGAVVIGGESELFRHQKTFFHPPAMLPVAADGDPASVERAVSLTESVAFERVGERLSFQGIALEHRSGDPANFAERARAIASRNAGVIALISEDPAALGTAARAVADRRPVLLGATRETLDQLLPLAGELSSPLGLVADDLEGLIELAERARAAGGRNLLLSPRITSPGDYVRIATSLRRLAVAKRFRPAGYPLVVRAGSGNAGVLLAGTGIAKYAGMILWDDPRPSFALALFTLRQNIYTDPQRPMKVSEAVYPIGEPGPASPLLVTTNFSLTYFLVSSEIANSGVPSHLAVMDADGLSVLTAWAAGKFVPEKIAEFLARSGIFETTTHRQVVIPGYVASIAGELEEALGAGAKVVVGPREATGLPAFLKTYRPGG